MQVSSLYIWQHMDACEQQLNAAAPLETNLLTIYFLKELSYP